MKYIQKAENGTVTLVYQGKHLADEDLQVPKSCPILSGMNVEEFDSDWNLKPLSQRVADGWVKLDDRQMVDGEKIVPKPLSRLVAEGLEVVPPGLKLEGETFVHMTPEEKVDSGILSPEEAYEFKLNECRTNRRHCYVSQLDPIRADIDRARINSDEGEFTRLAALYRQTDAEIRERFPKP